MTRHSGSDVPTEPPADAEVPAYEAVDTHEALVAWSRAYCHRAVGATDLVVDLGSVDWDVSTRAKRRAAAVLHPRLDDTAVGEPVDWAEWSGDGGDPAGAPHATDGASTGGAAGDGTSAGHGPADGETTDADVSSGPPACTVRLTWDAAQNYERATWTETLRHELVHVEQFQRYGTTGHGSSFERRARELSTTVRCQRFAAPKFLLTCPACESVVARRYRDCKLVRRHEEYRSTCCEAPLALARTGTTD